MTSFGFSWHILFCHQGIISMGVNLCVVPLWGRSLCPSKHVQLIDISKKLVRIQILSGIMRCDGDPAGLSVVVAAIALWSHQLIPVTLFQYQPCVLHCFHCWSHFINYNTSFTACNWSYTPKTCDSMRFSSICKAHKESKLQCFDLILSLCLASRDFLLYNHVQ